MAGARPRTCRILSRTILTVKEYSLIENAFVICELAG